MPSICTRSKKFNSICSTAWKEQHKFDTLKIWAILKKKHFDHWTLKSRNDAMFWSKNSNNRFFFALQFFSSKNYFLDDLKNKKNMFSFVFSVIKHAKAVNIANVHDQLTWIYNVIAFELTKNIDFSKKIIFVSIFFKQFDNKREIWFRIYFRKFNKSSFKFEYQSFFKYQNFNFYFKYDQKDDRTVYKSNQK